MKSFCVLKRSLNENAGKAIGAAVSASMGGKIGILHSGDDCAALAASYLAHGVADSGGTAILFGCCNESRVAFLARHYGLSALFYVSEASYVSVYNGKGKPLSVEEEKSVAQLISDEQFFSSDDGLIVEADSDSAYISSLIKLCGNLEDISVKIECKTERIKRALANVLALSGAYSGKKPVFHIGTSGFCVSACDEKGRVLLNENLQNICCLCSLESGQNLKVPFNAPRCLDELAANGKAELERSFEGGDELWQNDGVFLVACLLRFMAEKGMSLSSLYDILPQPVIRRKSIVSSLSLEKIADMIECDEVVTDGEYGVYARAKGGDVLFTPYRDTGRLCVEISAADAETADELARSLNLTTNGV